MNGKLKKVVSATAAAALLASVFSGFSLTSASAAALKLKVETDYIGSSKVAETFDSYDVSANPWGFSVPQDAWNSLSIINAATGGTSVVDGKALHNHRRDQDSSFTSTYTMEKAALSGKVYFKADMNLYSDSNFQGGGITLNDSTGAAVVKVHAPDGRNGQRFNVEGNDGAKYNRDWYVHARAIKPYGIKVDATIDLDENTVSVKLTHVKGDDSAATPESYTINTTIADSDIKSFSIYSNGAKSTNNDIILDNVQFYHVGEVEGGDATAIAASDIDYGIGTWTYSNGKISGIDKKKTAGVHYSNVAYTSEEGQKALSLSVPIATLPADGRTIKFYTDVEPTSDMQNFGPWTDVKIDDKTVRNYDSELFGAANAIGTKGINIASKTEFASIAFSTNNKKRYATVTVDGTEGEPFEIAAGDTVTINVSNVANALAAADDLFMAVTDTIDGVGASWGNMILTYQPKQKNEFDLERVAATAVDKDKKIIYLGKFNTTDMTAVTLAGTGATYDTSVTVYGTETQTTTFADADKLGTGKFAKDAATTSAKIATSKGNGSKYVYAVLSAVDGDKKPATPAAITGATMSYSSETLTQSAVQAQYYLENTAIDTTKVFKTDGSFDTVYYGDFTELIGKINTLASMSSEDVKAVFAANKATYELLVNQYAGWDVVYSIDDSLKTIYTTVTTNPEDADDYAVAVANRTAIADVNDSYKELNVTGQKFVGGQNYNVLATLVNILEDGDNAIIAKYNNAINAVWNSETKKSKLTQDSYLYNGDKITDLEKLQAEYATYDSVLKSKIDKDAVDDALNAIDEQLTTPETGFIYVTAKEFNEKFAETYEAYTAEDATYEDMAAALKLNGIDSLYAEISGFANDTDTYKTAILDAIKAGSTKSADDYAKYAEFAANIAKYAKAQAFLDKVAELQKLITDNKGVSIATYETIATTYNEAVKLYDDYKKAPGEAPDVAEMTQKITDGLTYMDTAINIINAAADKIVDHAKTTLDKAYLKYDNTTDGITNIKFALKYYADLTVENDHPNAAYGNAQKYLAGQTIADTDVKYGDFVATITEKLATYNTENAEAIKDLYDNNDPAFKNTAKGWVYNTDLAADTTVSDYKTNAVDPAKALNDRINLANGKVTYDSKAKKDVVTPATATDANYKLINDSYTAVKAFADSITALKAKGADYEAKGLALANLVFEPDTDYSLLKAMDNDAIRAEVQEAYEATRIDYKSDSATAKARKAVTDALNAYKAAVTTYTANYLANTGAEEVDFTLEIADDEESVANYPQNDVIAVYDNFDRILGGYLTTEYNKDNAITQAKKEVEDAAKAAVNSLTADITALYEKLSAEDFKYASADEIAADKATYDALVEKLATDRIAPAYTYASETETINYYNQYYNATSGDSMLAYIESALATWEDAWVIIEQVKAIEGQIYPVKDETGSWTINNEEELEAVFDAYNALPGNYENPGAAMQNVNNVVGTFFADTNDLCMMIGMSIEVYAAPIDAMSAIDSTAKYEAQKRKLQGVNYYYAFIANIAAANPGDEIEEEELKQEDIDIAKAYMAIIDTYYAEQTAALAARNAEAAIVGPAAEFDALVDAIALVEADPIEKPKAIAKATAKINEIRADENASKIIPYITKYSQYEAYVTATDKVVVDAFHDFVDKINQGTYADPDAEKFAEDYEEAIEMYNAMTDTQKSKASTFYENLEGKKLVNETMVAGNEAATAVATKINALATTYNTDGSAINAANYDKAVEDIAAAEEALKSLTDTYKDYGTSKVTDAVTQDVIDKIGTVKEGAEAFKPIADTVKLIDAIGEVTENSGAAIMAARNAYDALTSEAKKAEVTNYAVLVAAEDAFNAMASTQEAKAQATKVVELINAIDTPVTEESGDAIKAAEDAYNALSDNAKLFVTNKDVLDKAIEDYKALTGDVEGDITGDGKVGVADLNAVVQHILGTVELDDEKAVKADFNKDGKVNVLDLLAIVDIINN